MCDDEVAFCPQPETLLASDIQILGQPLRGTGNATPTRYAGVPGNAVVDATPFVKSPNHDVRPIVSLFRVEMYPDSAPPNIGDNPMKDPVAEHAKDTQNDPAHPGKVIYVNKGDIDGNEIPNFADAGNRGPGFGEVVLTFPDGIDLNAFKVKFKYDMNRPSDILQTGDSEDGFAYTPTKKGIRLWRHNASVVNGQMFLASDQSFSLAELNPTWVGDEFRPKYYELRLFVEGVTASDFCGDKPLIVYANARADWEPNNFVPADSIAFTVVEANIEVTRKNGDIVPEHKEEYNGTVVQLVPQDNPSELYPSGIFLAIPKLEVKPVAMAPVLGLKMAKETYSQTPGKIRLYKDGAMVLNESNNDLALRQTDLVRPWKLDSTEGGTVALSIVAEYPPGREIGRDTVLVSSIPCEPAGGRILFVRLGAPFPSAPYRNYLHSSSPRIQPALDAMKAGDNVLIVPFSGGFNENLTVTMGGVVAGLAGRWDVNDPIAAPNKPPLADHFHYNFLPLIKGLSSQSAPIFTASGVASGGKLSIAGLQLNEGTAQSGGAVLASDLATLPLEISFSSLSQNKSTDLGGAILMRGVKNGSIRSCIFSGNKVEYDDQGVQNYTKAMGGAIAATDSTLTVSDTSFFGNSAVVFGTGLTTRIRPAGGSSSGGGDLYMKDGGLTLLNCRSSGATAGFPVPRINPADDLTHFTGDGGSLLIHGQKAGTSLEIDNCLFENARSYGNGGAVYVSYDSSPEGRRWFVKELSTEGNNLFVNSMPTELGGYCQGKLANVTFLACQGGWQGGAVGISGRGTDFLVENCLFQNCYGGSTHLRDGKGGAFAVCGGLQTQGVPPQGHTIEVQGSSIVGCGASGNGGGFYVTIRGLLRLENSSVVSCFAENAANVNKTAGLGGGIHASAGGYLVLLDKNTISQNIAAFSGGGVCVKSANATFYLQNDIKNNHANSYGGGVCVTTSFYDDGIGNAGWGAALVFNEHGYLMSTSSSLLMEGNSATVWGGGVYIGLSPSHYSSGDDHKDGAKVTLRNAVIKNNLATSAASGRSFNPSQVCAQRVGNFTHAFPGRDSAATLDFSGCSIDGNPLKDIGIYSFESSPAPTTTGTSFGAIPFPQQVIID